MDIGDTADFAYTTTKPKTINITNPYSGGSGGVQSNFGKSSGPSYSGMGSIGSGGASKSKSSSPTNVGNPFGYK